MSVGTTAKGQVEPFAKPNQVGERIVFTVVKNTAHISDVNVRKCCFASVRSGGQIHTSDGVDKQGGQMAACSQVHVSDAPGKGFKRKQAFSMTQQRRGSIRRPGYAGHKTAGSGVVGQAESSHAFAGRMTGGHRG